MKRFAPVLGLLVVVAIVAALSCWATSRFIARRTNLDPVAAHDWMHGQLGLTDAQHKTLEPIEKRFDEQKRHYGELLRLANVELARAIQEDRADSPRVSAAVHKIHEAQGELQNATLQHIFEMRAVLTPAQYDQLIQLTSDALYQAGRTP